MSFQPLGFRPIKIIIAVKEWPMPHNIYIADICTFLGLASYHCQYIQGFLILQSPNINSQVEIRLNPKKFEES